MAALSPPVNAASSTGVETSNENESDAVARHVSADVESQMTAGRTGRIPRYSLENDPYGLSQAYKTVDELERIKANTSRKRDGLPGDASPESVSAGTVAVAKGKAGGGVLSGCIPLPKFGRSAIQARRVQGFYNRQNETIERLLKSVEEHREAARQEQGEDQFKFKIAVYGSFVANIILAALQVYGAAASGSLSLFTTMADAIFDPLSNITLILSNRAVSHVDPSRFPSGKARLETVGNIVFCFLMTAVSFILIAFSVKQLVDRAGSSELNDFHLPSVIAVVVAFSTKLALFLYTWALKDKYSQIFILWQDHRNDLLINGFGILTSVGGSKLEWWIDPMGAIILSVVVSAIWLRTAFAEFLLLVGVVASVETQQLITYVCVTHSPAVRQIDTVRVYHSGPRLIAEVDIVMDPGASLAETHDVAEALQFKLESLPDIERAYVHVDYETTHKPEHAYRKDL
ncbi:putative cation diffusion facilitator 1 protein [Phaeoacremonium minimum UCRPA7]|uniref:Putative cation diffusion facilitator 1 protein n=1 Tax=Phaeoacremonium minimum (strain UCR-PA7) TaxID=1286976 RepID=R8BU96_PHAM7|nr:putative cation diffusion facilitator 1 protein [Phaeoacremonium minimum UCRPA7]EOO02936.1 putative cation diffusion facilitator 1 protein [Phaeoacremonium minimum UCRPA7]